MMELCNKKNKNESTHRHAGLITMHHPESITDKDVSQLCQRFSKFRVICCVPRMEAGVLQEACLLWHVHRSLHVSEPGSSREERGQLSELHLGNPRGLVRCSWKTTAQPNTPAQVEVGSQMRQLPPQHSLVPSQ